MVFHDLRDYLKELDKKGLLRTVDRPMKLETDLMPLVRVQFRGMPESQRTGFLFTNVHNSKGKKFDARVCTGVLSSSMEIYATVLLPVNVEGAGLSFGDPHACQGDGEVCGTAVETSATVRISVKIVRNRHIPSPVTYSTEHTGGRVLCTTGIGPELKTAAIDAVESMISQLKSRGFREDESFLLCSVAGNLKISEIVDEPNFVVSMLLPESIIEGGSD